MLKQELAHAQLGAVLTTVFWHRVIVAPIATTYQRRWRLEVGLVVITNSDGGGRVGGEPESQG